MKKQEIVLVDLPHKTTGFMKRNYQVSNYGQLDHLLKSINYRLESEFNLPDFLVVNIRKIDSSEYREFVKALVKLDVKIPTVVLDDLPSSEKMKAYQDLGSGDYLDIETSFETILKQLKRVELNYYPIDSPKLVPCAVNRSKRLFDIIVSGFLLIALSPLFLIITLAIRLESKGPVFYWQKRVGTGYRIFNFYKFRSMRVGADQLLIKFSENNHYVQNTANHDRRSQLISDEILIDDDRVVKESSFIQELENDNSKSFKKFENDPRITKVGHWIRKTSIDELPQLLNVLKGDMSLVGNRPLPLYEAETLTSDDWAERFLAPAGITGLWQVTERGKKSTSADSRKRLDIEYARNHNFLIDLKILLKTPLAAIQQENV